MPAPGASGTEQRFRKMSCLPFPTEKPPLHCCPSPSPAQDGSLDLRLGTWHLASSSDPDPQSFQR